MFFAILFSGFNQVMSFFLTLVFIIVGFFIVKRRNKQLTPQKYVLIFLFLFSIMIFVLLLENLKNIFRSENALVALILSFIPSVIYYFTDVKSRK